MLLLGTFCWKILEKNILCYISLIILNIILRLA